MNLAQRSCVTGGLISLVYLQDLSDSESLFGPLVAALFVLLVLLGNVFALRGKPSDLPAETITRRPTQHADEYPPLGVQVCVCVCVSVCVCVFLLACLLACLLAGAGLLACLFACLFVCLFVCFFLFVFAGVLVRVLVFLFVCLCVCE